MNTIMTCSGPTAREWSTCALHYDRVTILYTRPRRRVAANIELYITRLVYGTLFIHV